MPSDAVLAEILTPRQLQIFNERFKHVTIAETAAALGISEGTARGSLNKTREALGPNAFNEAVVERTACGAIKPFKIRGVPVPRWVPERIIETYVRIGRVDGEEAAASFARNWKRSAQAGPCSIKN